MNRHLLIILVALPLFSWGQGNLVPNGGFEELVNCPEMGGQWWNTSDWTNASGGGSPDYYNACNPPLVFPPDTLQWPNMGVPSNTFGYQHAHSGEAYIGIYCFSAFESNVREYIQVQLNDSIVPSIRYQVSFYVSFSDNARFSINPIGAYFSKEPIVQDGVQRFDLEPQVVNTVENLLTDKDEWVLITDTFNSRYGGERYLTIGNFNTDSTSDTLYHFSGDTSGIYAYYYIDDVSVVAIDSIPNGVDEEEAKSRMAFKAYPNPSNGQFTLNYNLKEGDNGVIKVYNTLGDIVFQKQFAEPSSFLNLTLSHLSSGIYIIRLEVNDSLQTVERITILRNK